jgi:hypothetical protein
MTLIDSDKLTSPVVFCVISGVEDEGARAVIAGHLA